uniref:Large ribosomal subunit protein uL1c n=1 Tax=Rhizochromulina marina TaxID=1034831 RepID=A0A514CQ14_9STRA|nr:ribosomal protein L1 [Rhizochromulina marina]QDH81890.1 ribosomal protein L1 [Rhizochromulina marina]
MRTISKRLLKERAKVDNRLLYDVTNALKLVKATSSAKFNESIEAHISLNLDPKYADQQLRTTVILPHGTGRSIKIAVLSTPDKIDIAKAAGADIVGTDDLVEEISKGILDFDLLIATPEMMPKLAKLGRVLGPKGLMPSPKAGTVSTDLEQTIKDFKRGKLEYRVDKTGIVHISFGKKIFSEDQLSDNLYAFYRSVEKNKPPGVKGKYIKNLAICSTMGPSIFIDLSSLV